MNFRHSLAQSVWLTTITLLFLTLSPEAQAQGKKSIPLSEFKEVEGDMIRPNPYDKFIALDNALGPQSINWREILGNVEVSGLNPRQYNDKDYSIPALLGFRICDGVMSIKARDAERLKKCADDIEALGKRMGVKDADMLRAKKVRNYADRGHWPRVFLELGFLQQDIENVLDRDFGSTGKNGNPAVKRILYAAGWMQGARYTSTLISQNYNAETAGLLREPLLVRELRKQMGEIKTEAPEFMKSIDKALEELEDLVDVPMHGKISEKNINRISELTSETITSCVKLAK